MENKKDKNKRLDHDDRKIIHKEVFNILFVMLFFSTLFMMFMSFKGSSLIINSELLIIGLFIIWGIFIVANKNIKGKHFYLYKGISWFNISLTCLLFSMGMMYFHMKIQSLIIYILTIASYLGTLYYVITRVKNISLKGNEDNEKNKKRTMNIAIAFASFGYVLFYIISKHLSQNVIQMIMISGLLYFALDFISVGVYFTYISLKE